MELLEQGQAWTHPFVVGELACGNLSNRGKILSALAELPHVAPATHEEVLEFIEARRLAGRGLGWIDMHLLASSIVAKLPFWTVDKRLAAVARELGVSFQN